MTAADRTRVARGSLLTLLVLSCGSPPPADTPAGDTTPAGPEPFRAMVYNIRAGTDLEGEDNLARVAELIRETDSDLVLLQEVDRGTERSGDVDQVAVLERLTGLHGAFGRTLDYQGGEYGIAVLSRWPVVSDTVIPLPIEPPQDRGGGAYEPRGALVVRVDAPAGTIAVLNTHLDASGDDHYRRQEVEVIRDIAARLVAANGRTVVGGDFNAEPGSAVIRRMEAAGWTDAWAACGAGEGGTYPSDAPIKRIDYLFLDPGLSCSTARVRETTTSDHRPLLVVVSGGAGT